MWGDVHVLASAWDCSSSFVTSDVSLYKYYSALWSSDLSVLQQGDEAPSCPSLTDTMSVSTSPSSDTSDSGCKESTFGQ